MNQFKRSLLIGVASLGLLSPLAHGATIVIDDFNSYTSGSMIQAQNPAWFRFGVAFSDGIYSIAGGVNGTRGASVILQFNQSQGNNNASMRYIYSTPVSFEQGVTFAFDLAVNTLSPSTTVTLQLSTENNATIYEFIPAKQILSTSYENYSFTIDSTTMARMGGSGTLDSVLENLKNITIRFVNNGEDVKQNFSIDNLTVTPAVIPEPSVALLLPVVGGALLGRRFLRRKGWAAKS